ncbi:MAG: chromosomal replication initiator protein DnaA [Deltaproteobacteria bacterium]|nr:chromosomal replication initiator protein DnaA [Deltaproteobacteria bacterium]
MEKVWKNVKDALSRRIPPHVFKLWIEPIHYVRAGGDRMILACPNFYIKKWVSANYMSLIADEIKNVVGSVLTFSLEVPHNRGESPVVQQAIKKRPAQLMLPGAGSLNGRMLRRDYTFDRFVVGKNSLFAYNAARALAGRKDDASNDLEWNSLFLKSGSGMGKSHLSQAVGHKILSDFPDQRVLYVTAEDFTRDMVRSIKSDSFDTFKNRYRENCDVLLLEEVHLLSGRERTQRELSMTLDYLYDSGRKIIFSSCYTPGEIPKISDQLSSRLSQSVLSVIKPPDFKTRLKILVKKAEEKKIPIPMEVLEYLASELTENIRLLESGLVGVTSRACLLGVTIDMHLAQSVVENLKANLRQITAETIKKLVSREFNVSVKDMESKSRKQSILHPRRIAIFLTRRHTDLPLSVIGDKFKRYHATIIHSINMVEKEIRLKGELFRQVQMLEEKLESGKF